MNRNAGHIIRISGLVIEMLGIWGVYRSNNQKDQVQLPLPGGTEVPLAFVAVGVGFILWLTGTILVFVMRSNGSSRESPMPNRDPSHRREKTVDSPKV